MTTHYRDRYHEELSCLRADLPMLTGQKIEQQSHLLSLLRIAAVRCGEISTTRLYDMRRRTTSESAPHDVPI